MKMNKRLFQITTKTRNKGKKNPPTREEQRWDDERERWGGGEEGETARLVSKHPPALEGEKV